MKRYRIVYIDAAQEGMRLYGDVRDRAGNLPFRHAGTGPANALPRNMVEAYRMTELA